MRTLLGKLIDHPPGTARLTGLEDMLRGRAGWREELFHSATDRLALT